MRAKTMFPMLLSGCLAGEDPDIAETEEAIGGGTLVANAETSGHVMVHSPLAGDCSGIMVANNWVLTAAHCRVTETAPNTIVIKMGNDDAPGQQVTTGEFAVGHPSLDFALIRTARALNVKGEDVGYKLNLYSDTTYSLVGKQQTFFGYQGTGPLESAVVNGLASFNEYNHGGSSPLGQYSQPGDSGGGLVYDAPYVKSSLTGILKCGLNCTANPENFRRWVLSYLYDRPVELPEVWFLPYSAHPYLQAHPIEDSFTNSHTWQPCPLPRWYTWNATYDLETYFDFITLTTSAGATTFNGWNRSSSGWGYGPLRLDIRTDYSVRSPGLKSLPVQCDLGIPFPNPWPKPIPPSFWQARTWDPCPGGDTWSYTIGYDLRNAIVWLNNQIELRGGGTRSGTAAGPMHVQLYNPYGAVSAPGIQSFEARCNLGIQCHGTTCATNPTPLGDYRYASVSWDPCNGRGFYWRATYDFEYFFDWMSLQGGWFDTDVTLTGKGTTDWALAGGVLDVTVATDGSIGSRGLDELVARCADWGHDHDGDIQILAGTYGANCGGNRGNKTSHLAQGCQNAMGSCWYLVGTAYIGDPFPGCAKDYVAEYTCGASSTVKRAVAPAEANGRVVNLTCP